MGDKILTEAFDKIKAIEESNDPFCVGAEGDAPANGYTEVKEDDGPSRLDNLGRLEHEMDNMRDGIGELTEIQEELFQIIERLNDAIRGYVPNKHAYWKSYGLAQLSVVAGTEEYLSADKNIGSLIEELTDEYEAMKREVGGA